MGLLSKLARADSSHDLTKEELSLLLEVIKKANFSGEMLDVLYNLTYKLQRQFQYQEGKKK
jgi:hypothetical protein|tara:strand:- start:1826 stop:2008 length:183 start_codon:yes stop_codon:yes gene_type:complete